MYLNQRRELSQNVQKFLFLFFEPVTDFFFVDFEQLQLLQVVLFEFVDEVVVMVDGTLNL